MAAAVDFDFMCSVNRRSAAPFCSPVLEIHMLTEKQIDHLKSLLDRAISNGQFQVGVASPFDHPSEDLFDEGDRHDGSCVMNDDWKTFASVGTADDGPETAQLKLLMDQRSLNFIANGIGV